MPGDIFKQVASGERFAPSAAQWNAIVEAAKLSAQRQANLSASRGQLPFLPEGCAYVSNETGDDLDIFTCISIKDLAIPIDTSDDEGLDRYRFGTIVFEATDFEEEEEGFFGITQTPIRDGSVGVIRHRGITRAKVNFASATYRTHCRPQESDPTKMKGGSFGGNRVIKVESSGTGDKWCVIDMQCNPLTYIVGKLTGSLATGGEQTINVYKDGSTATGETCKVFDKGSEISATIGSNTMVDGLYDPFEQRAYWNGMRC